MRRAARSRVAGVVVLVVDLDAGQARRRCSRGEPGLVERGVVVPRAPTGARRTLTPPASATVPIIVSRSAA